MNWCIVPRQLSLGERRWRFAYTRNDTVERTSSVSETVLAGCQLAEVLRGSGDGLIEEFKCYTSGGFRVHSNVKLKWWFSGALNQSIKQHIAHTKTLECEDFGL